MFIQEFSIEIKSRVDKSQVEADFDLLTAYYRGSGQTQGKTVIQYFKASKLVAIAYTLDKNSLDIKFNNFYVDKQIKLLEDECKSKITYRTIGKTNSEYKGTCNCKQCSFYILFTTYVSIHSPLICGICNKTVALYQLPKYYDYGYMPILSWQTNYISCDSLQMNCEVGERWALNQMQEINSQLSKQGIEICKKIKELTGVPTYYFLYNYNKTIAKKNIEGKCLNCGGQWLLKKQLHDFYDYKCDKCLLVSTFPTEE